MFAPTKDRLNHGKKYLLRQLSTLYGGRVAEEEILVDITSGASGDIQQATNIIQHMVCEWGMSDLGPIRYETRNDMPGEPQGHQYSPTLALEIDRAMQSIAKEQYAIARDLVRKNRDKLELIAQALLEYETIDGIHVTEIIRDGKLTTLPIPAVVATEKPAPVVAPAAEKPAAETT
jgi:cell division protease FtsH